MTWIGGYCKSGTTWLKYIVAALKYRTNKPKAVEKKIPTVEHPKKVKRDGIYKTHVTKPPKGKRLYIVRNPVDICVSGINHVGLSAGKVDVDKYVKEFLDKNGNTIGDFGGWNESVDYWTESEGCYWLKYESLLAETRYFIENIAHFLDAPYKNIDYALKATDFKTMKNLERKGVAKNKGKNVASVFYNPKHKGYKEGRMFINRGESGYAREILTNKQIKAICEKFAKGMEQAGYAAVY